MKSLNSESEDHGLQIAPLIDVVFLLLIFFLVATTFYEVEKDITIKLAQATEGGERTSTSRIIVVNVQKSGVIVVNERVRSGAQLEELLRQAHADDPSVAVVVRCDRDAYHKHFVRILDLCEKVSIGNVAVAILQTEE